MVINLTLLRRPAIGFSARAAHQHRSLTVAQAVSLEEGLDGLLVIDDGIGACPVRAPQAPVETPGVEHAGERIPDVPERIRFPGQRAGAAFLRLLGHTVRHATIGRANLATGSSTAQK
jgi:hypothetical protein